MEHVLRVRPGTPRRRHGRPDFLVPIVDFDSAESTFKEDALVKATARY